MLRSSTTALVPPTLAALVALGCASSSDVPRSASPFETIELDERTFRVILLADDPPPARRTELVAEWLCECARQADAKGGALFAVRERVHAASGSKAFEVTLFDRAPAGRAVIGDGAVVPPGADPEKTLTRTDAFLDTCDVWRETLFED